MKYEEALKLVEKCGFNIEAPLESEVEEFVTKAIEKQISKRPIYEADGYADGELVYDTAYCPICEHEFEYGINEWGSAYCQDCGQALDWSEESEDFIPAPPHTCQVEIPKYYESIINLVFPESEDTE